MSRLNLMPLFGVLLVAQSVCAALSDGALKIEVISAYNLVVDSNIESPSGSCPTAAHLGLRVYNTGTTPLTGVTLRIGDLLNPGTFSGTAGIYPVTTIAPGLRGYSGSFSFTHQGGTADATRYIPSIPAGGSAVVYWLVSYPLKDALGKSVAGAANIVEDDLQLDYDMWVEGYENGSTLRRVYAERHMTCRNEISAMANKIWPNTTSKVPDQYLDVFNEQLGWRPNATQSRVPGADIVEGVWYDFGTIRQGFDNNGDLVPDYNAWMQPVGDPSVYDASCFRLVKAYGVVIVKLNDGTEKIIPFEDELYFENLPENNVGAVGIVYYEFMALQQGRTGRLSPYQEVASGYDNEKFNSDYGATIGSWQSSAINVTFDKNGPVATNVGSTITYDMTASNTGALEIGQPELSLPLVITDYIPSGLVYVASSALANNTLPSGVGVSVRYSTDGTTWVTSEPVPATNVVALQWWLDAPLAAGAQVTVRFQSTIPSSYAGVTFKNCGKVSLGNNEPIAQDCARTLIQGNNSVSGVVFEDDGSGGNFANSVKDAGDAGEVGIAAVTVNLYLDLNANGKVDSGDLLVATKPSAASTGAYNFTDLPDGLYVVAVDPLDPDVTANYALTTVSEYAVSLDPQHATTNPVSVTDRNFGFAPPLSIDKSGSAFAYEGQSVTYRIVVDNNLYTPSAIVFTNLYWVPSNSVQRIDLSLSNIVTVSTNTGATNPNWGIYVDRTRNRIYWADQVADTIWQDDLDATTPTLATAFISGVTDPGYVAIDHEAPGGKQYLWWSASGKLQRTDLGLSTPVAEDRYTIISDASCGIAIDEDNRWIYFISKPTANGKYTIYRQSLDGAAGSRDTTWSVALGVNTVYDIVINTSIQKIYFVDRGTGVKFTTVDIATQTASTSFNVDNGTDVRGLAVDVPNDHVFFSDSANNVIDCHILSSGLQSISLSVGTNPGDIDIEYGAGKGVFDVNTTVAQLSLTDTFPSQQLAFVSATIPPDSTTPAGTLTWNNLGPLNSGDTIDLNVTFRALTQSGNSATTITNTAAVTHAVLANGDPVNLPQDIADTRILPSGSIAGRVWADTDADGWQPAQTAPGSVFPSYGYETNEIGIGGVRVVLQVDSDNNGTVDLAVTNRTDASGNYLFSGLATNVRYRVAIDSASLPGTGITATGDPDDDGVNAGNGSTGSADGLWNNAGAGWFSIGVNSWKNAAGVAQSWDITNVNFGYTGTDPVVFGLVWLDLDRDGVRDAGEPGLSGSTVALTGASAVTLVTGADGMYFFRTNSAGAALNTGSYTVTVTLPSGPTWIYTFESPTNAFGVSNGNASLNGIETFSVTNSAETSGSWDFGLIFESVRKIGDTVYFDMNANGAQGTNEVGIAGVDVKLYFDTNGSGTLDAADYLWASQVTDSNGKYLFTNLASAVYFVVVDESDIPAGFRQTADPEQQGVVATAGDGMGTVILGASDILTIDFGYAPQGSGRIGDYVFLDNNGNGLADAGEAGISNVTVRLYYDRDSDGSYETLLATAQTGAGGSYLFSYLSDGRYRAVVDSADPDIPGTRTPSTTISHTVTLTGGVTSSFDGFTTLSDRSLDADFGFAPRPFIGDFVFFDANTNGTQDAGETGIPNVTLRLYTDPNNDGNTSDGVLLATTNTATGTGAAPIGYYQFPNLTTGGYYVVKVDTSTLPTWNGSPLPQTADPDRDGVPCWDNSVSGLPPGDNADSGIVLGLSSYIGADFGYQPAGVIGDTVWRDLNGNGLQDAGETGVSGVRVIAVMGTVTNTTYTDGDGHYSFANLADGSWTVALAATNFVSGGPLYNWTDTYDADGGLNHSTAVVINNGTVSSAYNAWTVKSDASLDIDFGFRLNGPYTLSGTVCTDDNGVSGICDDPVNETELAGLKVYLYTGSGLLLGATVTDVGGNYSFTNLPSGSYRVVLGTTVRPLDTDRLTTTASDTGATLLTNTGSSVIQDVAIASANREDVDFAFVPTVVFDYGDLPAAYGATTFVEDGARHAVPTNGTTIWLGSALPDADQNGAPSLLANGDDTLDGSDDEDGVVPVNMAAWSDGVNGGSVQVTVRAPAGQSVYLVGWIDFNQNGFLSDADEQIISTAVTGTGSAQAAVYTFNIPAGTLAATDKAWYARFRVFAEPPPFPLFSYTGAAVDGEVEDTLFRVGGVTLGDRVWTDGNGNGVQDAGEPGMTNVTVRLYNASSNEVAVTATDADGAYLFDNLAAGTYQVGFTAPDGYVFTVRDSVHASDQTDSDASMAGLTAPVALLAGTTNLTVDAGLYVPAVVYGYVFVDRSADGTNALVRNAGDSSVTNALVRLVSDGVVVASTNTDANGYYWFGDVAPGAISVLVSRTSATLVAVPTQEPSLSDVRRNRALPDEAGEDAYITYSVVSGYGVLESLPGEPLNFGFSSSPLSTAIAVSLFATGADVAIELWTVNESGYEDIVIYAWINNAWVEIGRVPAYDVIGEGSNRYQIKAQGLSAGGSYFLKIVDESGHVHYSGTPMAVKSILVQALSLQMETLLLEFTTEVGHDYVIKVSTDLSNWKTEFGSFQTATGWSDYTDAPFTAGSPATQVRVPVNGRKHAFFKIERVAN